MLNKAVLIGRLGSDPEIRHTQSGSQVASFNVATTERFKGQDGQMTENTEWHKVIAFSRLAEICGQYLHKGSLVYIEGKIQTRKWQDQEGKDRYSTEIVAREMKMLGGKGEGGSSHGNNQGGGTGPSSDSWGDDSGYAGADVPF